MGTYRLVKKITRIKLEKDFDNLYEMVKDIAKTEFGYIGELKIVSDNKWVSFYISVDY